MMCGRYYIMRQIYNVLRDMGVEVTMDQILLGDYYPCQHIPVLIEESGKLKVKNMRWGYHISHLSKLIINARSETVLEKKMFQDDIKERRCLIIANGFYEWDHQKHQLAFEKEDHSMMLMAGIYNKSQEVVILTRQANAVMKPIHSRMPVMIEKEKMNQWLKQDALHLDFNSFDSTIQIVSGMHQLALFD